MSQTDPHAVLAPSAPVPRKLYMLWDAPRAEWPEVVALCIPLWQELNPGWDITVFDGPQMEARLAAEFTPDVLAPLSIQAKSDLLRFSLLADTGGIWVDATCLPLTPIGKWFGLVRDHDFSAPGFRHLKTEGGVPPNGRDYGNWCLVSAPQGYVAGRIYGRLKAFFASPRVPIPKEGPHEDHVAARWRDFVGPHAAALGVYPYFTTHYLTSLEIEENARTAAILRANPFPGGVYNYVMSRMARRHNVDRALAEVLDYVRRAPTPCNKLDWQYPTHVPWGPVQDAVRERVPGRQRRPSNVKDD